MAFLIYTRKIKFDPINLQNVKFVEIPPPIYKYQPLQSSGIIWTIIPFQIFFPTIFFFIEILSEKESKIHTYMIIMGMSRWLYYFSHFITANIALCLFFLPGGIPMFLRSSVSFCSTKF